MSKHIEACGLSIFYYVDHGTVSFEEFYDAEPPGVPESERRVIGDLAYRQAKAEEAALLEERSVAGVSSAGVEAMG